MFRSRRDAQGRSLTASSRRSVQHSASNQDEAAPWLDAPLMQSIHSLVLTLVGENKLRQAENYHQEGPFIIPPMHRLPGVTARARSHHLDCPEHHFSASSKYVIILAVAPRLPAQGEETQRPRVYQHVPASLTPEERCCGDTAMPVRPPFWCCTASATISPDTGPISQSVGRLMPSVASTPGSQVDDGTRQGDVRSANWDGCSYPPCEDRNLPWIPASRLATAEMVLKHIQGSRPPQSSSNELAVGEKELSSCRLVARLSSTSHSSLDSGADVLCTHPDETLKPNGRNPERSQHSATTDHRQGSPNPQWPVKPSSSSRSRHFAHPLRDFSVSTGAGVVVACSVLTHTSSSLTLGRI
ncbi:hypothetical protein K402DRAFT_404597 [Aulographum hederae CBS 113979]|uniref:Uncharacterized protein n=1 Tax=Aulographum hederae CBS 113979 TaxID=1176131 RepID=A0A6G1GZ06_9PEZI|nr:hypothetical protein K402DRAFT_404597 [Aulographum hederae CBS 113979]